MCLLRFSTKCSKILRIKIMYLMVPKLGTNLLYIDTIMYNHRLCVIYSWI